MAVANLVSLFNPQVIVFGGGIFGPAVRLLDRIEAEARRWAQPISIGQGRHQGERPGARCLPVRDRAARRCRPRKVTTESEPLLVYRHSLVFAAACLGMLLFGVTLTTLGSVLPPLIDRHGLDRSSAGSLLSLMSQGILVASLVFGPIVDRYGYKGVLIGGAAGVLLGLEGIAFAPSGWFLATGGLRVRLRRRDHQRGHQCRWSPTSAARAAAPAWPSWASSSASEPSACPSSWGSCWGGWITRPSSRSSASWS